MESLFKSCNICWVWPSMPRKGLSYFVYLLHVVTNSQKLQCYNAALVRYAMACQKFSEITNRQYLWKGSSALILHTLIYMLLDIQ